MVNETDQAITTWILTNKAFLTDIFGCLSIGIGILTTMLSIIVLYSLHIEVLIRIANEHTIPTAEWSAVYKYLIATSIFIPTGIFLILMV